ncbi:ATP-dependent RecD-like DNA helicase [bacterium]|nr:ATP-dependent RecD-like DNA helicase [bacterium]
MSRSNNRPVFEERQTDASTAEDLPRLDNSSSEEAQACGVIDKIIYKSPDEKFAVASLKLDSGEQITITGGIGLCSVGEELKVSGTFSSHKKYGKRLQVREFSSRVPRTLLGIRKFLASGLITGIGEKRAEQIVERFGENSVDVIENDPERLNEIPGLGKKAIKHASEALKKYKGIRELLIFLQGYGITVTRGTQIFNEYGAGATSLLSRNPYRLADDITGIGFRTADEIARKLGMRPDNPDRIRAGISYVLRRATERGHTYLPKDVLIESVEDSLSVGNELISESLETLIREEDLILDPLDEDAVFLPELASREKSVAEGIARLTFGPMPFSSKSAIEACSELRREDGLALSEEQARAVNLALTSKVVVITGGPGTGKTALVGRLIRTCQQLRVRAALCAPTGRAAKRLSEATGFEAKTVHRLLKYDAFTRGFKYNRYKKLPADLVVMDEASMADTTLMSQLVSALPDSCCLVIVGDVDQLPSVGPGAVLSDIIASGVVPTARLHHIFRQESRDGSDNLIVVNAHRINRGEAPIFPKRSDKRLSQFYFVDRISPDAVLKAVVELASKRIPSRFGLNPLTELQVLTPMHKGKAGTNSLNEELQRALNPAGKPIQFGGRVLRVGDKVMQTKNNYDKEVFNGDIGVVAAMDTEKQKLLVDFSDRTLPYSPLEMSELVLAYAISVHKSQGSEYTAVILPLMTQHFMLLQRNLIYTAVTRAKRLVVIVGSMKALSMAISNDKTAKRHTLLSERLKSWDSGQELLLHG